jgi:hypothetical protein
VAVPNGVYLFGDSHACLAIVTKLSVRLSAIGRYAFRLGVRGRCSPPSHACPAIVTKLTVRLSAIGLNAFRLGVRGRCSPPVGVSYSAAAVTVISSRTGSSLMSMGTNGSKVVGKVTSSP